MSVRREPLHAITRAEVAAEGFPQWTPAEFVTFFCDSHKGIQPGSDVTRIEWRYLDAEKVVLGLGEDGKRPETNGDRNA